MWSLLRTMRKAISKQKTKSRVRPNRPKVRSGDSSSVSAGANLRSESARAVSPLFSGLLILAASFSLIAGALWCSADGAKERAAMIRDLEKISNFEPAGEMTSAGAYKKVTGAQARLGE